GKESIELVVHIWNARNAECWRAVLLLHRPPAGKPRESAAVLEGMQSPSYDADKLDQLLACDEELYGDGPKLVATDGGLSLEGRITASSASHPESRSGVHSNWRLYTIEATIPSAEVASSGLGSDEEPYRLMLCFGPAQRYMLSTMDMAESGLPPVAVGIFEVDILGRNGSIPQLPQYMPAPFPTRKVYSPNSPELFEVGDSDPESGVTFYPPSDDTYLFLDVLHDEVEKGEAIGSGSAACILEVGPGSGVLSAYLVRALDSVGVPAHSLALDVNPRACEATEKTAKAVGVEAKIHVVLGDFNQSLHWLRYRPDIIICNPPYVPSPPEECQSTGIEASWAGGDRGREVIDRMVPVFARLLQRVEGTRQPVLYFLLEKQNRPGEVCRLFEDLDCSGECVGERQVRG
ncbi:HemK methyltransferase member 2, partial [Perkinsus olseni]